MALLELTPNKYLCLEAREFSEGLAAVFMGDRWGYIDKQGRTALWPKWAAADSFSEGLAAVYEDGVGHSYIDHSGRILIRLKGATAPGEFEMAWPKSSLLPRTARSAATSIVDGRFEFGYIDREGRLAIPGAGTRVVRNVASLRPGRQVKTIARRLSGVCVVSIDWRTICHTVRSVTLKFQR